MSEEHPWLRPHRGFFPLSEVAERCANDFGPHPVMKQWNGEAYDILTYSEFRDKVFAVASWLIKQGLKPGDRVSVLAENRPEWGIAYFGIQTAGGVAVPVDRLLDANGIRFILNDPGVSYLFTTPHYAKLLNDLEPLPDLKAIVTFDEKTVDSFSWDDILKEDSSGMEFPKRELDDLAAILYTSGTTGTSKGVMLSHFNILRDASLAGQAILINPGDTFLSVLPLHHAYECTLGLLTPIYVGACITYSRSLKSKDLIADIKGTKVTIMVAVPLLYEKMHAGIVKGISKKGKFAYNLFRFLYGLVVFGERFGKNWGRLLFKPFRKAAGLNSFVYMISGGGPLDPATSKFFNRFGIHMLQGYGLTETSPMTHYTYVGGVRHECVGIPYPEIDCKLIDVDENGIGEVLIRGPVVFKGYYKNEKATAEAIDEDGWFHTGDLGIIHEGEYLQITGRKKSLIVTGGGKNVYPEEIENDLNKQEFILESLVIGKKRESGYGEHVAALIYPVYDRINEFLDEHNIKPTKENIDKLIKDLLKEVQKNYPDYKKIRSFKIMDEEFQKTSTRKIKRFLYGEKHLDS